MSRRVLIALGIFFLFSVFFYLGATKEHKESAKSLLKPLGSKALKDADLIELTYDGKDLTLKKVGERWVIVSDFEKPAQKATVEEFLSTLAELVGEERAKGEKYFSRFKLGDKEALHVVLKAKGQELAHFLIGKRGPRWESTFVRLKGDKTVYLVPVNLLAKLEIWDENPKFPPEKSLVDLEVLTLPIDEIKELSFSGPKTKWRLVLKGQKFLFTRGGQEKELKLEEGKKFLRKLFPILAEEVVPPEKFKGEEAVLSYLLRTGEKGKLFLVCEQKDCLVKRRKYVYRVKRENLAPLFKPFEEKKPAKKSSG